MKGSVFNKIVLFKQSLFSMPWMVAGFLLAARPLLLEKALYLSIAFFSARTVGMCLNRLIHHKIHAKNPRTATRALPQGEISRKELLIFTLFLFILFFWSAFFINTLCFALSPFIALLLVGYSFTKRFTWGCHFVLGLIQCFSPLCAWLAVTGSFAVE